MYYHKHKLFSFNEIRGPEEGMDYKEPVLYTIFKNDDLKWRLSKFTRYDKVWISYLGTEIYDASVNSMLPKLFSVDDSDPDKPIYKIDLGYYINCNILMSVLSLITISFQTSLLLIAAVNNVIVIVFLILTILKFKNKLFTLKFKI